MQKVVPEIMEEVKCAKRTVRKWIKRWADDNSIESIKISYARRKRSLNEDDETRLVKNLEENKYSTRGEIIDDLGLDCTPQTIGRYIKKVGYGTFVAAVEPDLELRHKKQRIEFCTNNLNLNWENVVATDEKTLQNYKSGKTLIKRMRKERFKVANIVKKNKNGRCKINLWSYITYNGLGKLYNVSTKYKAIDYCETLSHALKRINEENPNFILLQDGARHHTSIYTRSYLNNDLKVLDKESGEMIEKRNSIDKKVTVLSHYPARSPDLNIIENIWSIFQYKYNKLVLKLGQPKNKVSLWAYAKKAWKELREDKELVKRLYDSYPQRVRKILHNQGESSHY